jgi:hypothetical protein
VSCASVHDRYCKVMQDVCGTGAGATYRGFFGVAVRGVLCYVV